MRSTSCLELIVVLLVLLGVFHPSDSQAHRINVFAWQEGDTVHTQSSANRGKPVVNGEIRVSNAADEILLTGTTDAKGKFSFPRPGTGTLRIELLAGPGHKGLWILDAAADGANESAGHSHPAGKEGPDGEAADRVAGTTGLSADEIREIVDEVVTRRISPLAGQVAALGASRTGFKEVFGGLGYILGLMGVGAYVQYRRKTAELETSA